MTRAKIISAISAVGILMTVPAFAQDPGEFVVRVPVPGIVVPGLEPNPAPEFSRDPNLPRTQLGFDQQGEGREIPRMNRAQRREVAARCDIILSNPGAYSADALALCDAAILDR